MRISWIKNRHIFMIGLMEIGAVMATLPVHADERSITINNPALQQECGSCHVVYPPQLLSVASWRALMGGLDKHFGTDASVGPATRSEILRYLQAHASGHDASSNGKPLLRITETRWFVHEHTEELPRDIWRNPAVKSPANCTACHTAADKGNYSERTLHVPGGMKK